MFEMLIHILEMNIAGHGDYSITWIGTNSSGNVMPPGHYFYIVSYGANLEKGRMVKY